MKRAIVLAVLLVMVCGMAWADATVPASSFASLIPATKTGFGINCAKNSGNVCVGIAEGEILSYKGLSANLGVATPLDQDAKGLLAGSINYNLGGLAAYGLTVPYGNNLEVGLFADRDFDTRQWSYGPVVQVKIKIGN